MEFINATKISPLLSKVQIKVCYVGQQPNRNGSIITKDVATKFGENILGVPIVGFYNDEQQDFEAHNREISTKDGKFKVIDTTKPYGFVDPQSKVWFQKFLDDGKDEREYLLVEGYIWTEIYEESKRIIEKGNNQSMELNDKAEQGFWTTDNNSGKRIFIISDGLIEKLCILGENVEPCFEGSQIKTQFSLENDPEFIKFKTEMFSMISELQLTLSKGGFQETMEDDKMNVSEFEKKDEEKSKEEKINNKEDSSCNQEKEEDSKKDEKKKKEYNLEEIEEYVQLQKDYNLLKQQNDEMSAELDTLRNFKLEIDKKEKQAMVDSFYMLSDEEKKDVIDHLDTYSLKEVEAELSIICVRNKVNFNLEETKEENTTNFSLNIDAINDDTDTAPDWIKLVRAKSE